MNIYQRNLGLPPCGMTDCNRPVTHADYTGSGFCDAHAGENAARPLSEGATLDAWWCLASLARSVGGDAALAWSELDYNEFPIPDDEEECS